jgi:hypothetical protein
LRSLHHRGRDRKTAIKDRITSRKHLGVQRNEHRYSTDKAEGLTVEAYLERLISAAERAEEEVTTLALEGINSGAPMEVDAGYWQEKHRRLDERLKKTEKH